MICHINFVCCIYRSVEFTNANIPLVESAANKLTVKRLESRESDYFRPTIATLTETMDYYPDIILQKALFALRKVVPLPFLHKFWSTR